MWLLVAATAVGPFGLHILIPSMPGLVTGFATDYGTVQLTLTLYLIGMGVAQLGLGPLSDRFGRRPVMIAGFAIYIGASTLCALSWSIEALIAGRILQAVGVCAGQVLSRAIVRDVLDRDRGASTIAFITMAMAIAPALAPLIGAYIDLWLGWRSIFVGLVLIALTTGAAIVLLLNETNLQKLPRLDFRGAFGHYRQLLRDRAFLGYSLSTSVTMSTYFGFLAGTPLILVEQMGQPVQAYGIWYLLITLTYMFGNWLATRFTVRIGGDRMMAWGVWFSLLAVLAMIAAERLGPAHPIVLFGPMCFFVMGNGLSQPNGISAAVGARPQIAGAASGLMGFTQMLVCATVTLLVGHIIQSSPLPMLLVMLATATLAVLFFLMARYRSSLSASDPPTPLQTKSMQT